MYVKDIKTTSPFRDLFPISKKILDDIYWDMERNGYDKSKPIVLWEEHSVVVDGHTRLRAAIKAKIDQIPVVFKRFTDENTALKYAIKCQKNRRNLTDSELVACVVELDKKMPSGQRNDLAANLAPCGARLGKSASETANLLGVSTRKVERIRTVMDRAPDDIREMVRTGRMTVNSAYNRTVNCNKNPGKIEHKELEEFCDIVLKRFDRGQMRIIIDIFTRALEIRDNEIENSTNMEGN
jgi:ParB family chromosome partitioning protein